MFFIGFCNFSFHLFTLPSEFTNKPLQWLELQLETTFKANKIYIIPSLNSQYSYPPFYLNSLESQCKLKTTRISTKSSELSVPIWTHTLLTIFKLITSLDLPTKPLRSLATSSPPLFSGNSAVTSTEKLKTKSSEYYSNRTVLPNATMLAPIIAFRNSLKTQSTPQFNNLRMKP